MLSKKARKKRKSNGQLMSEIAFFLHEDALISAVDAKAGSYTDTKEFNILYKKGLPKPPDWKLLRSLKHNGKPLLNVKLGKLNNNPDGFRFIKVVFIDNI